MIGEEEHESKDISIIRSTYETTIQYFLLKLRVIEMSIYHVYKTLS